MRACTPAPGSSPPSSARRRRCARLPRARSPPRRGGDRTDPSQSSGRRLPARAAGLRSRRRSPRRGRRRSRSPAREGCPSAPPIRLHGVRHRSQPVRRHPSSRRLDRPRAGPAQDPILPRRQGARQRQAGLPRPAKPCSSSSRKASRPMPARPILASVNPSARKSRSRINDARWMMWSIVGVGTPAMRPSSE